jgi:hypothetical protein
MKTLDEMKRDLFGHTAYGKQPWRAGERAVARATDPPTSRAAAESLTAERIRESQEAVLKVFRACGAMTDVELVERYFGPKQSTSGLRTRRHELVERGLLRDSGKRRTLESNRQAIVWEVI